MSAAADLLCVPDPASVGPVVAPYTLDVPYWKKYVVRAPFGLTFPSSVAEVCVTRAAPPVVTVGLVTAAAAGAAAAIAAVKPAASMRRVIDWVSLLVVSPTLSNNVGVPKVAPVRYSSATSAPVTCCGGPSGPK